MFIYLFIYLFDDFQKEVAKQLPRGGSSRSLCSLSWPSNRYGPFARWGGNASLLMHLGDNRD
jgi:hypothetical protein